jgi:hypothetical protein
MTALLNWLGETASQKQNSASPAYLTFAMSCEYETCISQGRATNLALTTKDGLRRRNQLCYPASNSKHSFITLLTFRYNSTRCRHYLSSTVPPATSEHAGCDCDWGTPGTTDLRL